MFYSVLCIVGCWPLPSWPLPILLVAVNTSSPSCGDQKMLPYISKCLLRGTTVPGWEPLLWAINLPLPPRTTSFAFDLLSQHGPSFTLELGLEHLLCTWRPWGSQWVSSSTRLWVEPSLSWPPISTHCLLSWVASHEMSPRIYIPLRLFQLLFSLAPGPSPSSEGFVISPNFQAVFFRNWYGSRRFPQI